MCVCVWVGGSGCVCVCVYVCVLCSLTVIRIILMVLGVLVFIPVVGLTGFHMGLICIGRSTNEHVSAGEEGGLLLSYF